MDEVNLRSAKILGVVGSILCILGTFFSFLVLRRIINFNPFPIIFFIAATILILFALNDISKKIKNRKIYSNFLTGIILSTIGFIILLIALGGIFISLLTEPFGGSQSIGLVSGILLIVFNCIFVVSTYFIKMSFDRVSVALNNSYFKTSGLILFIGSFFLIVLIGVLAMLVGVIFEIIAFFKIKDELEIKTFQEEDIELQKQ
ncbi:MAG TPA: DUF996 domain-containing protein [Caldisericia bacterium]|nr:DUF996 domain-containing protein [Caldisericia bacterium]